MNRYQAFKRNPATIVVGSYLLAILTGTLLLLLPQATVKGISFLDSLFTATSAICVTGLIVVDTGSAFTPMGHSILLLMIQLGGLGLMTYSVLIFDLLGRSVSFRHRMLMQSSFGHTPRKDILLLLRGIFLFTFGSELLGAVLLFSIFNDALPGPQAAFSALFHSVSAFCNAGFSLYADSFTAYRGHTGLNATVCALIVLGGLGFPVAYEIGNRINKRGKPGRRFSVQTKTVLVSSVLLILVGAAVFWVCEREAFLRGMTFQEGLLSSVFQSVTARTAGFNTVDIATLTDATLCFIIFLMFVGASPGSCGGGVKTTTLAVLLVFAVSRLRSRVSVNMFRRTIPGDTVMKSTALVLIAITLVFGFFFLLLFTAPEQTDVQHHDRFLTYLFETVSAFGTVGLSTGVTGSLNSSGKLLIILLMLIGRVGVLTFAYVIAGGLPAKGYELAEENVMIG